MRSSTDALITYEPGAGTLKSCSRVYAWCAPSSLDSKSMRGFCGMDSHTSLPVESTIVTRVTAQVDTVVSEEFVSLTVAVSVVPAVSAGAAIAIDSVRSPVVEEAAIAVLCTTGRDGFCEGGWTREQPTRSSRAITTSEGGATPLRERSSEPNSAGHTGDTSGRHGEHAAFRPCGGPQVRLCDSL